MEKVKLFLAVAMVMFLLASCEKESETVPDRYPGIYEINGDTSICAHPVLYKVKIKISESLFGPADMLKVVGQAVIYTTYANNPGNTIELTRIDTGSAMLIIKHEVETDTINIRFEPCHYLAYFPEAFNPFSGSTNLEWHPTFYWVTWAEWEIRSENNELIYESKDIYDSWDGTWNDRAAPPGLYQYYATFETYSGEEHNEHGWIELYR